MVNALNQKQLEKKRVRLLFLLASMRAARESNDHAAISPLWGQAKKALKELYGTKANQLGIYKDMESHYTWARSLLNAKERARKDSVSFGTAGPSTVRALPGLATVRTQLCIHHGAIDRCVRCLPPVT
ncbi:hypothetical protein ACRYCC_27240 [Actinomadura scrupuli]|uniref:hypothetical protein n=1 Tax=Actinomadura scrupuli TaxID=559629 RepID=UPI003D97220A